MAKKRPTKKKNTQSPPQHRGFPSQKETLVKRGGVPFLREFLTELPKGRRNGILSPEELNP